MYSINVWGINVRDSVTLTVFKCKRLGKINLRKMLF